MKDIQSSSSVSQIKITSGSKEVLCSVVSFHKCKKKEIFFSFNVLSMCINVILLYSMCVVVLMN